MKRRILPRAISCLALAILVGGWFLTAEQRDLSKKIVRLHVVANSDTSGDQAVKLKVRDAVLAEAGRLLEGHTADAKEALRAGLPAIEAAADRCLAAQGSGERASAALRRELFPTREDDTFSLPAGTYTALRVTIGKGEGHNWWCVVFPSLCMSSSMDEFEEAARTAGLTDGEIGLITEKDEGCTLKFRSLELLGKLRAAFRK